MSKPRKREGSPYYWYDFTVNGHRLRGSTETNDYELAKSIIAKLRAQAVEGKHFESKDTHTLDQACGRYWMEYGQFLNSSDNIKDHLQKLMHYFGKQTLLHDISSEDVPRMVTNLRKKRANATINRVLSTARKLWGMADEQWSIQIKAIPWKRLMLQEPQARTRWITNEEAEELIECSASHLQPVIRFALLTGLRLGNITSLDWRQVHWGKECIEFRTKSSKPGRKHHIIPIVQPIKELLLGQNPQLQGAVFTYKGQPIKQFRRSFRTACERAGLEDFRFHDLRHTAATWMRKNGVPIDVVQEVLGHEDIATTKKYAHVDMEDKRQALNALQMTQSRHNEKSGEVG